MEEKSKSSSESSSSYTAESLAIETEKRIYDKTQYFDLPETRIVVEREILCAINLIVKDTRKVEQVGQEYFKRSLYTDLERVLNRLK